MKYPILITVIILIIAAVIAFAWQHSNNANKESANEKKFVIYQGARMVEGWPEEIKKAQLKTTHNINGKLYNRVRYGEEKEDWNADKMPCHDCRVIKGQFHVVGCDVEQCPVCGGQAISCECKNKDIK